MTCRPLECGHCQKPASVLYKEVACQTVLCTEMCATCPVLETKLHGSLSPSGKGVPPAKLLCASCHTPLEAVKRGEPLGCAECYAVFEGLLSQEFPSSHVGKTPGQKTKVTLSDRLFSLNEALSLALKKENYEQAAYLRDQINSLSKRQDD